MERALRHCAVAEERHHHGTVRSELSRGGSPDGDRQPRRDDPVRAEDPDGRIRDVHRAPAPAIRAVVLAHQLGEHADRVQTLREAVAVAAMGGRDHVRWAE